MIQAGGSQRLESGVDVSGEGWMYDYLVSKIQSNLNDGGKTLTPFLESDLRNLRIRSDILHYINDYDNFMWHWTLILLQRTQLNV